MTASKKSDGRAPVVLSKNEALYPPSSQALKIALVAIIIAVILAVGSFVLFPI